MLSRRPQIEYKGKRKERQVVGLSQSTKKVVEHEGDGDTNCNWRTWNSLPKLGKEAGRDGNQRTDRDHLNYSTVEIGQNTVKSPGDLKRGANAAEKNSEGGKQQ